MIRMLALGVAAGLAIVCSGVGQAENLDPLRLDPVAFSVLAGALESGGPTLQCPRISPQVEALADWDGMCLKLSGDEDNVAHVEIAFQSSAVPDHFLLRVVSDPTWQELIAIENPVTGVFDEIPMDSPTEDGSSSSGPIPGSYVDSYAGTIRVWLVTALGPALPDDKTLDEVEIVVPPPG